MPVLPVRLLVGPRAVAAAVTADTPPERGSRKRRYLTALHTRSLEERATSKARPALRGALLAFSLGWRTRRLDLGVSRGGGGVLADELHDSSVALLKRGEKGRVASCAACSESLSLTFSSSSRAKQRGPSGTRRIARRLVLARLLDLRRPRADATL